MITQKLFYEQPHARSFSATLLAIVPDEHDCVGLVLDATAFYPEGGGQPSDTGRIQDYPVLAVREADEQVIHVVRGPVDAALVNQTVIGVVDWPRRFDHMQQHSGQHLLSAAFHQVLQATTVGFHLGRETSQIDLQLAELTEEAAARVERLANEIVFANKPVATKWIDPAQASAYPLRKPAAKALANARMVYIQGFEYSFCCGTHVAHTGEVGLIKIRQWERRREVVRVDFVCGGRALQDYHDKNRLAKRLSGKLSAPVEALEAAVDQSLLKCERLAEELQRTKQALYKNLAAQLAAQAVRTGAGVLVVDYVLVGASPQDVALLAKELLQQPDAVVLLAGVTEAAKAHLLFASAGAGAGGLPMGALLQQTLLPLGGKGGGSATAAQGGCPGEKAAAALQSAKSAVLAALDGR